MSISGWYYLHENNELIYKPDPDAIVDIRDSDFCKCAWPIDPTNRQTAWDLLVESLALGANKQRVNELADKWHCDDRDADNYADRIGVILKLEGNQWCAHKVDFVNVQESPVGFGDNKLEAMADLANSLEIIGGLMWRTTFSDLVQTGDKGANHVD